jgi:hypothetical protein
MADRHGQERDLVEIRLDIRHRGRLAPTRRRTAPDLTVRGGSSYGVEVAGIEPASFDVWPGLLRAQFAVPLLDPTDPTNRSV